MKILFGVHQFFPTHYTGTERYVLNLTKQFQKMGHYVKILTYTFDSDLNKSPYSNMFYKEYHYEGVPVRAIRHQVDKDNFDTTFHLFDTEIFKETQSILEDQKFDIYHCAHPLRISSSIKAAKALNLKVVLTTTDYFFICPLVLMLRPDNSLCDTPDGGRNCLTYCYKNKIRSILNERISQISSLISYCDVVISPSKFLIALFNYTGVIPASRFILSPHGFDYSNKKGDFKKMQKEHVTFGYIGTIQYHKGVHIMIEAFKKVKNNALKLQIWGGSFNDFIYHKNIMKLVKKDRRIELKGKYDFDDLEDLLQAIDVVIVPSIWYENAPLTISTALAYGIPVIASDIGGMKEAIMDGKNGLLFRVGDVDDLADKIRLLSENKEVIEKISKTIQYPIRIEEEAFKTELVYKNLLNLL